MGRDETRRAVLDRLGSERRSVLRGTAIGLGATLGVSGSASGDPERGGVPSGVSLDGWDPGTVAATYDKRAIRAAVEAAGVLEPLAEAGHISAPTAAAVGVERLPRRAVNFLDRSGRSTLGMGSITETDGGIVVTAAVVDDRVTPQLYVVVPVEAGTLMISVLPEAETGVADLITEEGSQRLVSSPIQFATECEPYDNLCYCCENLDCSECTDCSKY